MPLLGTPRSCGRKTACVGEAGGSSTEYQEAQSRSQPSGGTHHGASDLATARSLTLLCRGLEPQPTTALHPVLSDLHASSLLPLGQRTGSMPYH